MKHVLTITELHNIIPETAALEGANFKDLKHLISSVTEKVEARGKWEFI